MATLEKIVSTSVEILYSPAFIIICLLLGVYFSIRLRFPQVRHFKKMVRLSLTNNSSNEGLSGFEAFCLTVGGRVGVGSISGVATAICLGGPGSIFWMMVLATLASSSAYIEAALAQIYKVKMHGEFRGGPSFYIEKGLGQKWYAVLFACAVIFALGLCTPGVQTNSIVDSVENVFGINRIYTGLATCLFTGICIFGGIKWLGKAVSKITPIMTIGYVVVCLAILVANITQIPQVIGLIFSSAFGTNAVFGGIIGSAISWGVKRGIYSCDAGIGVGAIASGSTAANHPAEQGLIQAFSVWITTLVICLLTALTILCSGCYNVVVESTGEFIVENLPGIPYGVGYSQAAFDSLLPGFGAVFIAIAIFFFAFTSIIAFHHYAETNLLYLLENKSQKTRNIAVWVLRFVFLGATFLGVSKSAGLVWNMADMGIAILSWMNLVAIFIMQKDAITVSKDYDRLVKEGEEVHFDPDMVGLKKASDVWREKVTDNTNYAD